MSFTNNMPWAIYTIHKDTRKFVTLVQGSEEYTKHLCTLLNMGRHGCYSFLYCSADIWDGKNSPELLSWERQNGYGE